MPWTALRAMFLVAVVAGAWWSWRASGGLLADALDDVAPERVVLAGVLVLGGLLSTGVVWHIALAAFGPPGPVSGTVPPFFLAQLGKYIPGSVWSFAAQGALGAAQGVPARVPATAAVLFLGIHVASGLVAVGVLGWWTTLPAWVVGGALVVGLVGLLPAVYRVLGRRLSGRACDWRLGRSLRGALVMAPAWCCYTAALVILMPTPDPSVALVLGCSYALAFAAGVAVPVAPAGLGARDGVLVLLLAPTLGAGPAGAVAVLARLVHTAADFLLAGLSWCVRQASAGARRSGRPPAAH